MKSRWLTVDEKIKLSTFIKDFELQHESATAKEIAAAANTSIPFPNREITDFDIFKFRKASGQQVPRVKRAYNKRKKNEDKKPESCEGEDLLKEQPSLLGLHKKIQELADYAKDLAENQRKQLEKLFLA